MKTYLVGGYVRDKLRGVSLKGLDKDYVIVGATPKELIDKGFANDVQLASELNVSDKAPFLVNNAYQG